eukprot:1093846-Pyramimonas_sp.AAC.1
MAGHLDEVKDLPLVRAAHDNHVHLNGLQAGPQRQVDRTYHALQALRSTYAHYALSKTLSHWRTRLSPQSFTDAPKVDPYS